MITKLEPNEIFVFGSNLQGIHGAGAAKFAVKNFGAKKGWGEGITGQCYALPTKITPWETMPLDAIRRHVKTFITYARDNPHKQFLLTAVGCGYAGYRPEDIAPFFKHAPNNVVLPDEFIGLLT